MKSETLNDILLLKSVIKNDPRFLKLEQINGELQENLEVRDKKRELDLLVNDYEEALDSFGENSPVAKDLSKKIYLKKLELDNLDISKRYTEAFIEVSDVLREIDSILFYRFRKKIKWLRLLVENIDLE